MSNLVGSFDGMAKSEIFDRDFILTAKTTLRENGILLLRGLIGLSDEEVSKFIGAFGDQYIPSSPKKEKGGLDVISFEEEREDRKAGVTQWHLDFSFLPSAAKETLLYCVDPSEQDVRTHFCSMYEVARQLPENAKNLLRNTVGHYSWRNGLADDTPFVGTTMDSANHPLLFVNPTNGREVLYYCELKLERFLGIPEAQEAELRELIRSLVSGCQQRYVHSWKSGDLLMFDAVGMSHRRDVLSTDSFRHLKGFFTRFEFPKRGS